MASSSSPSRPLSGLSVGDSLRIYRDGERRWYPAEITAIRDEHNCEVLYGDGEREWLSLREVKYIVNRVGKGSNRGRRKKVGKEDGDDKADEQIDSIKKQLLDIGNADITTLRRSKRIPMKNISDGNSSMIACRRSKRLQHNKLDVDSPKIMCSNKLDHLSEVICTVQNVPQRRRSLRLANKLTCTSKRKRGSESMRNTMAEKKYRYSAEVEYPQENISSDADYLDEKCADDSVEVGISGSISALLCSACQTVAASDFLVRCVGSGCIHAMHTFCLSRTKEIDANWLCPYCKKDSPWTGGLMKNKKLLPKKIQSIVGHRRIKVEDRDNAFQVQFLIKWKTLSHHHDSWVPFEWMHAVDRTRLGSYQRKFLFVDDESAVDCRKPEWFKVDRVVACRKKSDPDNYIDVLTLPCIDENKVELEFLVKWVGLDYDDATWESSSSEELSSAVSELVKRHHGVAEKIDNYPSNINVCRFDMSPNYLRGGHLYDYQLEGLNWILSNFLVRNNVILADEMGLGKTVQVVSFVKCMKHENLSPDPALIIAPKSILFHWEKEFCHWASDLNVIIYQGEKQSRRCIQLHELYSFGKKVLFDALVTNYELVLLDNRILKKIKWSAIVIDEAHKIKNLDCKLASCLTQYKSDFRLLLTGTPLQNTLLELFALLHFLDPEKFSDPKSEAQLFSSIGTDVPDGESLTSDMKISQIHELLRPRMLRRMKSDALPETIPAKKWVEVPCALTDFQRELYVNILEKNHKKLNDGIRCGRKIILNFILMELKKCCNHPYIFPGQESCQSSSEAALLSMIASSGKLLLLEKLLPKLRGKGNRVLIFSQMTKMLDILEDFLSFLGLAYFRIDGQTPISLRQQQMKEFNSPGCNVSLFLISTRAGGLGLDLPTADRVIIYDPDFNPFMDLQAQSRVHRIGQTRPVVVYQLITKGTIEEKILQKSRRKLAIENLVMNPSRKPSVEDLHSVLLHGAKKILSRKHKITSAIHYDDSAIETLMKLDPAPDEKYVPDENGYLGSIYSFNAEMDNEETPPSPKVEDWETIMGPQVDVPKDGELGRGKRKKKAVSYQCEEESDSDEIYSPEDSLSNVSSDEDMEPGPDHSEI
uniref:CHD3-type chromatin-remodeling factor PICKLE n=1 Tax=Anthurium amnicola TaxID=1678845 RepID=A0A1D1Z0P6_9ARAE